ncbi:hypothetical protein V6N11_056108 [Hibiscus sabdariffa]|uniref:Uncharacterized protein n=1 Tax=Hibiscus sabdariffa TaxID=183260 RepID=A0ABR2T3E2_9ROSI
MPTSHKETVSEERMALFHSIITRRHIKVGYIIVDETFKCIEKVKGTIITTVTWRQLTGLKPKRKGKGKGKVSTPKLRAAKSVPVTPPLTDYVAMLAKVIQNQ